MLLVKTVDLENLNLEDEIPEIGSQDWIKDLEMFRKDMCTIFEY